MFSLGLVDNRNTTFCWGFGFRISQIVFYGNASFDSYLVPLERRRGVSVQADSDVSVGACKERIPDRISGSFIFITSRLSSKARWSRGMIRASGARGPGFKSRTSPCFIEFRPY